MVVPTRTAQPSHADVFRTDAVAVTYVLVHGTGLRDFVHSRSPPSLDLPLCAVAPETLQPESIALSSVGKFNALSSDAVVSLMYPPGDENGRRRWCGYFIGSAFCLLRDSWRFRSVSHCPNQTPTRRNRRCPGLVVAAGPPDDFIDTTFVEEEGSSYVGVDFEKQELRVIFETMDKNNIYYKMLAEDQIVRESVVLVCGMACRGYLYMVGAECT